MPRSLLASIVALLLPALTPDLTAGLGYSEQIGVETFGSMREVERFQLKTAEKFYLAGEFAIAGDEYEKFLTLYESSPGAPYAQLMWSHCQRKLRKVNTAIRDGFRSVIDYWPDSAEATLAAYLIADSYRSIGEVQKAEAAFRALVVDVPDHHVALLAKLALLDLARVAKDEEKTIDILRELTFDTRRTEAATEHCVNASTALAKIYLGRPDIDAASESLATSITDTTALILKLQELALDPIRHMADHDRRDESDSLADYFIKALDTMIPDDLGEEDAQAKAKGILYRIAAVQGAAKRGDDIYDTYLRTGKLLGEDDDLLGRMASWHRAREERDKARAIYVRFDNQVAGQQNIAEMFREEGRWDEAIATYQELIGIDPGGASDYQWAIAECYESSSRLREAISAYRLSERFPSNYFRMASCHRRLKEFTEALSLYAQLKTAGSNVPEADLQSAFTWEEAGKRENAIKAFQLTCKAHPKSSQASRSHAHLQDTYKISITLGGATDE